RTSVASDRAGECMSQRPRGGRRELAGNRVATLYPRSSRLWRVVMATIEKAIDVEVPVRAAYNQWTQFEDFPRFMEGVLEVRQLDDKRLHWRAEIGGQEETRGAESTEQVPDARVASRAPSGAAQPRVRAFPRTNADRERITAQPQ